MMNEHQDDLLVEDATSLAEKFNKAESIVNSLNDGSVAKEALEDCIKSLKTLKRVVERMDLMSANETTDDIPTSSLQYLLVEPYLATAVENISVPIEKRALILEESQKLFNEFLLNSDMYGFNPFPSTTHRSDAPPSLAKESQLRQHKVEVSNMHGKLSEEVKRLAVERARSDDEAVQRELAMKKLQLWCMNANMKLEQISRELQILEHRRTLEASGNNQRPTENIQPPLKTFVIPKADEKKKVFGRGYPAAPKQTVNEWYDQMVDSGRFPGPSEPTRVKQTGKSGDEDQESVDEDEEMDNEEARQKRIAKDDYLDSHRTGWGNTKGKG